MNSILEINNLSKSYHTLNGEINTLEDINISVYPNDFIAIVGSSGCGKSTILSLITGIIKDYKGCINTHDKKIGYMLQTDCLLPWLTIWENAILGLKLTDNVNENSLKRVKKLLKKYNLDEFKDKYPSNLSGGMKQRVG